MMEEYTAGEEEVHLEPRTETTQVAEPEVHKEAQNPAQQERKKKRVEKVEHEQDESSRQNYNHIERIELMMSLRQEMKKREDQLKT